MASDAMQRLYDLLAEELTDVVKHIESKFKTTQNRYGDYMQAIGQLNQAGLAFPVAAELLIMAGGNKGGIASALRILS